MTKIEAARQEYKDWCSAIGIDSIPALNQALADGMGKELINLCEARQERKYAEIANQIYYRRRKSRIVMMSGPSSSGKTSSSLRIAQQCRVLGLNPKVIELDNYFVSRDKTPKDENGEYDFESLYAMDIELLNKNLNSLLNGEEIELPKALPEDIRKIAEDWKGIIRQFPQPGQSRRWRGLPRFRCGSRPPVRRRQGKRPLPSPRADRATK